MKNKWGLTRYMKRQVKGAGERADVLTGLEKGGIQVHPRHMGQKQAVWRGEWLWKGLEA